LRSSTGAEEEQPNSALVFTVKRIINPMGASVLDASHATPPPRQCPHKVRFSDSFLFLCKGALLVSSIGIVSRKILTYTCTLTPALLHSHPNPPPQTPLKLRPYAPQTIASSSLLALQPGLGYVYILARSQPTAVSTPSRGSGIPFAPDIHKGITVLGVHVGFTDAQQDGDYFATVHHMGVCKGTWFGSLYEY